MNAVTAWTHICKFHCPMREWAKWVSVPLNGASEWSERSKVKHCVVSERSEWCKRTNIASDQVAHYKCDCLLHHPFKLPPGFVFTLDVHSELGPSFKEIFLAAPFWNKARYTASLVEYYAREIVKNPFPLHWNAIPGIWSPWNVMDIFPLAIGMYYGENPTLTAAHYVPRGRHLKTKKIMLALFT